MGEEEEVPWYRKGGWLNPLNVASEVKEEGDKVVNQVFDPLEQYAKQKAIPSIKAGWHVIEDNVPGASAAGSVVTAPYRLNDIFTGWARKNVPFANTIYNLTPSSNLDRMRSEIARGNLSGAVGQGILGIYNAGSIVGGASAGRAAFAAARAAGSSPFRAALTGGRALLKDPYPAKIAGSKILSNRPILKGVAVLGSMIGPGGIGERLTWSGVFNRVSALENRLNRQANEAAWREGYNILAGAGGTGNLGLGGAGRQPVAEDPYDEREYEYGPPPTTTTTGGTTTTSTPAAGVEIPSVDPSAGRVLGGLSPEEQAMIDQARSDALLQMQQAQSLADLRRRTSSMTAQEAMREAGRYGSTSAAQLRQIAAATGMGYSPAILGVGMDHIAARESAARRAAEAEFAAAREQSLRETTSARSQYDELMRRLKAQENLARAQGAMSGLQGIYGG